MASSIIIRDLSESVVAALRERSAAAGLSMEAWLREQLAQLANGPVVRRTYALRAFHPSSGATFQAGRYADGSVEIIKQHELRPYQRDCRELVMGLMRRN